MANFLLTIASSSFNDSVLDSIKTIQINDEGFRIQVLLQEKGKC